MNLLPRFTPPTFLHILFGIVASLHLHAADELPNLVVFISDDMGRAESSVYGSTEVATPTMDMLASNGMTFDEAYVASPSCCPNRFSLLTGLMPARHGAHPNHSQVKPGTEFLFPILQKKGYTVASFGKVAHGRRDFPGVDMNSPRPTDMSENVTKWFAETDIEGPVCLLVGDRRPHVAWSKQSIYDPNAITLPSYLVDTPETREHWARYMTDITGMDQEMGRIHRIAQEQFGEDFLFLFTSDHGGQWPRGKWNLYDTGTRIPMIVSWPGVISKNERTNAMVSWVDVVPTLIDVAGAQSPKGIDGQSFLRVLNGKKADHRDRIFTTHTGDGTMNIFPIRSVRIGKYKYIHNLRPDAYFTNHSDRLRKDGAGAYWDSWDQAAKSDPKATAIIRGYYTREEFELFDLEADPMENDNLAPNPEFRDVMNGLRRELAAWAESQGDDLEPHRDPYLVSEPIPDLRK
ncbi:MAG: sulfatase [Opitutaceae bacterium]|nr:sulfatase [Opitutaceae bacterium]